MDEVSVTLSLNNPIYDNNVELTTLKLITEAATLLSDTPLDLIPNPCNDAIMVEADIEGGQQPNMIDTIDTMVKCDTSFMEIEENDLKFGKIVPLGVIAVEIDKTREVEIEKICMENRENGRKFEKVIPLGAIAVEIEETEKEKIVGKVTSLEVEKTSPLGVVTVGIEETEKVDIVTKVISLKNQTAKVRSKSVFELEWVPLWGSVSICGKRPEMEDAVAIIPRFMKVPMNMFVGDHVINSLSQNLSHITSHFFGVYDGHGGSQVADYCRERIHYALTEELNDEICNTIDKNITDNRQVEWQKTFTNCFQKVDDEVGGKAKRGFIGDVIDTYDVSSEPIAPETIGSTAVVALISSSHIIVSNCGDSRAVLYRGKEPMPLSVDHKPNREDEYERIEASGGKVIQWNGHRVFGVLAMSRSIGDRYLKPWIIPDPELAFIPRTREDECLILASDGLWDVMTNEEVCEIARKRILLWHKKNGDVPLGERGVGIDPAAQAAADYLSIMALQKGSKDNISIIVVDLKPQRKFKNKS